MSTPTTQPNGAKELLLKCPVCESPGEIVGQGEAFFAQCSNYMCNPYLRTEPRTSRNGALTEWNTLVVVWCIETRNARAEGQRA